MSEKLTKTQKSFSLHSSGNKVFFTDIKQSTKEQTKLKEYVNDLSSKINYAKWKQQLVLKYNYMPMKRIAEKVQNEKVNYIKKINEEENNCAKILSGQELTVQLDLFREFRNKLALKMEQIETKIEEQKVKNQIMQKDVAQKRDRLKQKMKQNMNIIRQNLQKQGIHSKKDIVTLIRSKSTKDRLQPSIMTLDSYRKTSEIDRPSSQNSQKGKTANMLYRQCLQKVIQSIQSMNTTQDIQSGIYLDVMEKKQYTTEGRYSMKSKISDILHSKFGHSERKKIKSTLEKTNFQMDWETFKQLNWKQIMGIIMVKDKKCVKMNNLLKIQ